MSAAEGEGGKGAVAVHGAVSAVGRDLCAQLAGDADFSGVLAIDDGPAPPEGFPPKVTYRQIPPGGGCEGTLQEAGVKHAIYLAPFPAGASERSIGLDDVEILRRFLAGCEGAGVTGLVVASGSWIYGARAENPSFFAEGAPLKPGGLPPAELDFQRERLCIEFARRRPTAAVAVCRLAYVIGPGTRGLMSRFLDGPKLQVLQGFDPPVQFVHAEDVSRAALKLLKSRRSGVYNVAADDYTTFLQLGRVFKKPLVRDSLGMAKFKRWVGSFMGGLPPAWLPLLQYPILLTNRKLKRDTGYQFRYGSETALMHHAKRAPAGEPQTV